MDKKPDIGSNHNIEKPRTNMYFHEKYILIYITGVN